MSSSPKSNTTSIHACEIRVIAFLLARTLGAIGTGRNAAGVAYVTAALALVEAMPPSAEAERAVALIEAVALAGYAAVQS